MLLSLKLKLFLLLLRVNFEQGLVEVVDVGQLGPLARLYMLLAELVGETLLPGAVIKRADVHLVAARTVALNAFVLFGVVESLDCRVALAALDALIAVVPPEAILESFAVFRGILDEVWRPSEVSRVVGEDAAF